MRRFIQRKDLKLYSPIAKAIFVGRHVVGKPSSDILLVVPSYTTSTIQGATVGGFVGALGAVFAELGKDASLAFLQEYLKNPAAVSQRIAADALDAAYNAYLANYPIYQNELRNLSEDELLEFRKRQALVDLYEPARKLYHKSKNDRSSSMADSDITTILSTVDQLFDDIAHLSAVSTGVRIADAFAKSGLDIVDYEPYVEFSRLQQQIYVRNVPIMVVEEKNKIDVPARKVQWLYATHPRANDGHIITNSLVAAYTVERNSFQANRIGMYTELFSNTLLIGTTDQTAFKTHGNPVKVLFSLLGPNATFKDCTSMGSQEENLNILLPTSAVAHLEDEHSTKTELLTLHDLTEAEFFGN